MNQHELNTCIPITIHFHNIWYNITINLANHARSIYEKISSNHTFKITKFQFLMEFQHLCQESITTRWINRLSTSNGISNSLSATAPTILSSHSTKVLQSNFQLLPKGRSQLPQSIPHKCKVRLELEMEFREGFEGGEMRVEGPAWSCL